MWLSIVKKKTHWQGMLMFEEYGRARQEFMLKICLIQSQLYLQRTACVESSVVSLVFVLNSEERTMDRC
jgi:hypothetical protein